MRNRKFSESLRDTGPSESTQLGNVFLRLECTRKIERRRGHSRNFDDRCDHLGRLAKAIPGSDKSLSDIYRRDYAELRNFILAAVYYPKQTHTSDGTIDGSNDNGSNWRRLECLIRTSEASFGSIYRRYPVGSLCFVSSKSPSSVNQTADDDNNFHRMDEAQTSLTLSRYLSVSPKGISARNLQEIVQNHKPFLLRLFHARIPRSRIGPTVAAMGKVTM